MTMVAQEGNLDAAIEELLNVEKQCRLAGDVAGTRKADVDIAELCFKDAAWKTLNDQIVVLSKRSGQLKQIYVEIERARLIKRLAKIKAEQGKIDEDEKNFLGGVLGTKAAKDLKLRIIEHYLSDMVNSKGLDCKDGQTDGDHIFPDSNGVLNSWASNLEKLLDLVEKSCHQIHKETMIHKADV